MWLHSEAAPVVDSATQHLLEENNQLLNQISANIETFKVCIYLYAMSMVCTCPFCTLECQPQGTWCLQIICI